MNYPPARSGILATIEPTGAADIDDARLAAARLNLLHPLSLLAGDFRARIRAGLHERGHHLRPSQSAVIVHLGIHGSRPSELAARAGMSKQAMGKLVDELEQIGYVAKMPDPVDGRARLIRFTDRGLALLADSAAIVDGIWRDYAALIGTRRLKALRDELHDLLLQVTRAREDADAQEEAL